ncbi:MAG: HEAT repeat domain-containing protein [Crocosphaera sp.]|nr:HEAT repeat domain-containing protein [Crocosphaera sp.]
MNSQSLRKFLTTIIAIICGFSFLVATESKSWALSCSPARLRSDAVKSNIEELKTKTLEQQLHKVNEWSKDLYPVSDSEADLQNPIFCSLIATFEDTTIDLEIRKNAAHTLIGIGTGAEDAIPSLREILINSNEHPEIRKSAIVAIRGIDANYALKELVEALKDENAELISAAAEALLSFTDKNILREAGTVPILKDILKNNPNSYARSSAAKALGQIAPRTSTLVMDLKQALKDPSWVVRKEAADALGRIALDNKELSNALNETVPNLLEALNDKNYTLRAYAIAALRAINVSDEESLKQLRKALKSDPIPLIKGQVALALGTLVAQAETFDEVSFNSLIEALPDHPKNAADGLRMIAESFPEKVEQKQVDVGAAVNYLDQILEAFKSSQAVSAETVSQVELQRAILHWGATEQFIINDLIKNWGFWAFVLVLGSYGGIFWLRPLWLLKLDPVLQSLDKIAQLKNPIVSGIASIVNILLRVLSPLTYHPRILDAWVLAHLPSVKKEFEEKDTVKERQVYVSTPVIFNDRTTFEQLTGKHLQDCFTQHKQMLIWGEGGSGKTSLACQIAQWGMSNKKDERLCEHPMLPVLIEDDFSPQAIQGKCPFTAAILGQLNDELAEETESISETLLEKLLRKQRVLVIVDHLSEMSEQTRQLIRPEMPECPVKALIVTSRIRESLGHLTKTTIQPLRIEGHGLSLFMENYLRELKKLKLFTKEEFFAHCAQLSRIAGQGDITVLLARLYTDQMINAKEKSARAFCILLADNIPDLMLSYLNTLNRDIQEHKLDDRKVHKAAKIVAWECLKKTYTPTTAMREDTLMALGIDEAEQYLEYLEKRLHLIQTVPPAQDRIRFALDPIAEYLAALYLLELYDHNQSQWSEFLQQFDSIPKDFLRAMRDCCDAKGEETGVPDEIITKLRGVNGKAIKLSDLELVPSN